MLYLCANPSKAIPATKDFLERALTSFTIGKLSELNIFGKPTATQVAYSGYKANIECFLQATVLKSKVSTSQMHVPFPSGYICSAPLPLPRTVFALAGNPSKKQVDLIMDKLSEEGVTKVHMSHKNTYTLDRPTAKSINNLKKICTPTCARIDGYAQLEGTMALLPIYGYIDAFLATHTYSFKSSDFERFDFL
jgi:hypothetical protein